MTTEITTIPHFHTGTWTIDPVHSEISFTARHLGVAKVRGTFDAFAGAIVIVEDLRQSSVTATIQTASVNTRNGRRDADVRSTSFLDVAVYPTMTFRSAAVRAQDDGLILVDGELTIRGISRPIVLEVEVGGVTEVAEGSTVAGFSAATEISRTAFGVTGGPAGAVVGDTIKIALEIEATVDAPTGGLQTGRHGDR